MSKIIKIDNEIISIGTNDGKIKEMRREDFNFNPVVGDEVEIYESETNSIVSKVIKLDENNQQKGININVNNSNNTIPNQQIYYRK